MENITSEIAINVISNYPFTVNPVLRGHYCDDENMAL